MTLGDGGGVLTLSATGQTITVAAGLTATIDAQLSGSDGLDKAGTGILELGSTSNDYTGSTDILAGTLQLGASNVIPNSSLVEFSAAGTTLDMNGNSDTVAGISSAAGVGTITSSVAGASTLTLDFTGSESYGGLIEDGSGTVSIIKDGPGTQTFAGANTYEGVTTIRDGVLLITNGAALGGTLGNTLITGGTDSGQLQVSGGISSAEPIRLDSRSVGNTDPHIVSIAGSNTLSGGIDLDSSGPGNRFGIDSDTGAFLTISGTIDHSAGAGGTLFLGDDGDGLISGDITNTAGTLGIEKTGTGTWTLSGANTYEGDTFIRDGTLALSSASSNNISTSPLITVGSGASLDVTGITAPAGFEVVSGQTLAGDGTVVGDTTLASGAFLSPGDGGVGTLTFTGDLDISAAVGGPDGSLLFDVGDTVVLTSGTLTIGTDLLNVFDFVLGGGGDGVYPLFLTDNTIVTVPLAEPTDFTAGNRRYRIFLFDYNTDIYLSIHLIPEPKTLGLAVIGLLGLVLWRPRRRRA